MGAPTQAPIILFMIDHERSPALHVYLKVNHVYLFGSFDLHYCIQQYKLEFLNTYIYIITVISVLFILMYYVYINVDVYCLDLAVCK